MSEEWSESRFRVCKCHPGTPTRGKRVTAGGTVEGRNETRVRVLCGPCKDEIPETQPTRRRVRRDYGPPGQRVEKIQKCVNSGRVTP